MAVEKKPHWDDSVYSYYSQRQALLNSVDISIFKVLLIKFRLWKAKNSEHHPVEACG